jgi:hypothetical protein
MITYGAKSLSGDEWRLVTGRRPDESEQLHGQQVLGCSFSGSG